MAERSWYIASDGRQEGPFPEKEIRAFIAAGRVTAETLVWSEGMTAWQRAGDIPGLIPAAAASPPPLTPRPAPLPGSGQWAAAGPGIGNEAGTPFTADFGVWLLLGRVLILGIGTLLVIPAPWVATSFYRWFIEHVHVPQIPALGFAGKAGDIWWVFILIAVLTYLGLPAAHTDSNGHVHEAMFLPYLLIPVKAVLSWYVLRWVIEKITAQGQPLGLRFTGGVGGYIGWTLFLAISFITIIGWAWVATAWTRWIAAHIEGTPGPVVFAASGWDLLWRSLAFGLGSIFIVPIPWLLHWYVRWYVSQFAIASRGA
jgi:hypothetical protein